MAKKNDNQISRISKEVDALKGESIRFLQEMISARSENPPGNYDQIVNAVESRMKKLGIEAKVIECIPKADADALLSIDEFAIEAKQWLKQGQLPGELLFLLSLTSKRKTIIGRLKGKTKKPTLILNAHMDTVPKGDGWTVDPFAGLVKNGRIYGRGSNDNKGGIAITLTAAEALINSDIELNGNLDFVYTADEEIGSWSGIGFALNKGLVSGDACLCTDGYTDSIVSSFNGFFPSIITVQGKGVHGTLPTHGVNAIEKMTKIINIYKEVEKNLHETKSKYPTSPETHEEYTTVVPCTIQGGTRFYIVPDKCQAWIDTHVVPDQDPEVVKKQILSEIEKAKKADPDLKLDLKMPLTAKPAIISPEAPIVKLVQHVSEGVLGKKLPMYRMTGLTDARFFMKAGIPTVTYGPLRTDNGAHAGDEWIDINDLTTITKVYALTAKEFLSTENK
nr:ArgE/DapE family deacylase [Candidatus Njordarchaeum guaymaensis]